MPLKEKLSAVRRTAKEKSPASLASMTVNFFSALVKIVAGALGSSFYVIVNGLYSFAVGGAKATYFFSKKRAPLHEEKRRKYLLLCGILTAATLLYLVYTLRLFFHGSSYGKAFAYFLEKYGTIFGVTLATVAFTELGFAIAGLVSSNREGDLLKNGLKCVNLASSFIAIALTQVALLTLNNEADMTFYNAVGGTVFGSACLLICAYMLFKYFRAAKNDAAPPADQKP